MAEFQWWLLLLGLVAGGGLVAVVYVDGARREADLEAAELPAEAAWIADRLGVSGDGSAGTDPALVEQVLLLHAEYLEGPPPDRIVGAG
jgi:hypothetical protein